MTDGLEALLARIRACRVCRDTPVRVPLPHEPNPIIRARRSARICIAGQAPGTRVHASSIPFNDPSGDRLRDWMGVSREEFYDENRIAIVPMGFCFPGLDAKGGDKPPRRECPPLWRAQVFAHLPQVDLLILVGSYAQRWHLGTKESLTDTVAAWRQVTPSALPLPHPSWRNNAWLKRHPWFESDVLPYLRKRVRALLDGGAPRRVQGG